MAVPDYQTFMRPLLESLPADGSEVTIKETGPKVAARLQLSEDDLLELLASGSKTVFMDRLSWAKTYLTKAEAVQSTRRGYFRITERGLALLRQQRGPISNQTLQQFSEFQEWIEDSRRPKAGNIKKEPVAQPSVAEAAATPDGQIEAALNTINISLKEELLERFRTAAPNFFERVVINLLQAMGFTSREGSRAFVTGKSGDSGIDGVVHQDALGLDAIYVQAKRYAEGNSVGRPDIQRFVGSMAGASASKGVFVTTSHFSREANDYVDTVPQRMVLIDGDRLAELALRYNIGARVRSTLELKDIDEDYFLSDVRAAPDD